jgi:hypothetical protein
LIDSFYNYSIIIGFTIRMNINMDEYENEQVVKLFEYKKPMELFERSNMVKICAPMVRYTKFDSNYF